MAAEAEFIHAGVSVGDYGVSWRQSKTYCKYSYLKPLCQMSWSLNSGTATKGTTGGLW